MNGKDVEIEEWLNSQAECGNTVKALFINEPVLGKDENIALNKNYSLTSSYNKDANLPKNAHLDNVVMFKHSDRDTTMEEYTLHVAEPHRGITWLKVHLDAGQESEVHMAVVYAPNKSRTNTQEYITSLYTALQKQVNELDRRGKPVLVFIDANCPHKAPHEPSGTRNTKVFKELLKEGGLQVINWTELNRGPMGTRYGKKEGK
jgi:hypothetical protein